MFNVRELLFNVSDCCPGVKHFLTAIVTSDIICAYIVLLYNPRQINIFIPTSFALRWKTTGRVHLITRLTHIMFGRWQFIFCVYRWSFTRHGVWHNGMNTWGETGSFLFWSHYCVFCSNWLCSVRIITSLSCLVAFATFNCHVYCPQHFCSPRPQKTLKAGVRCVPT